MKNHGEGKREGIIFARGNLLTLMEERLTTSGFL